MKIITGTAFIDTEGKMHYTRKVTYKKDTKPEIRRLATWEIIVEEKYTPDDFMSPSIATYGERRIK